MITKDIAIGLRVGDVLHHVVWMNADGTPARYRVNGKVKTWKTRPDDFRIPVKRGLHEYGYVEPDNAGDFYVPVDERMTREQYEAILRIYDRDRSVAPNCFAFMRTVQYGAPGMNNVCFVGWKGMMLGIDPDGYTHS